MKLTVLYFAAVRDIVGRDEEIVEIADDVKTIAALSEWLERTHAGLAGRLGAVRFARNEVFAAHEDAIADGDVIAIIPPVAGG